jgi:hypothetical protein
MDSILPLQPVAIGIIKTAAIIEKSGERRAVLTRKNAHP